MGLATTARRSASCALQLAAVTSAEVGKYFFAQEVDGIDPPFETEPQVEDEVVDTDVLELLGLLHHLFRGLLTKGFFQSGITTHCEVVFNALGINFSKAIPIPRLDP